MALKNPKDFYAQTNYGEYFNLQGFDLIEGLHEAWNYEANAYDGEKLIFYPFGDNEFNSELLKEYGLRVINDPNGKYRVFQNIETDEIYRPSWQD